ncbi:hypothetical protein JIG36_47445 [Actinoplanes sp. LDG1-06]|uniref:Uncharacterized protein n=1 Tax=Paractinoplanes ovalisporus TaxID=2810368 RepID=A0ABS2ATG4_9ACTN|nr:hypothetical protein [Actinoplanes ovalisporus]MBM2623158.1 hypothetical protein [Actinoplanes ovalisporus]
MRVLFDGPVPIAYGQVYVTSFDGSYAMEGHFAGQRNGLCGAVIPGDLFLTVGTRDGDVRFTVELHETEPPAPAEEWQDVVEAPFILRSASVALVPWGTGVLAELPLTSDTPSLPRFRVRYCAQNMDEGNKPYGAFDPDEIADDDYTWMDQRPDRYLLSFWPENNGDNPAAEAQPAGSPRPVDAPPATSSPSPDAIVRQSSETAAYWHSWAATLPAPPSS